MYERNHLGPGPQPRHVPWLGVNWWLSVRRMTSHPLSHTGQGVRVLHISLSHYVHLYGHSSCLKCGLTMDFLPSQSPIRISCKQLYAVMCMCVCMHAHGQSVQKSPAQKSREWFVWHQCNLAAKESGLECACVNKDDFTELASGGSKHQN